MQDKQKIIMGVGIGIAVSYTLQKLLCFLKDKFSNTKKNIQYINHKISRKYDFPLPRNLKLVLMQTKLCHLSCQDDDSPHTCLMNFSYLVEDIIIMATSKNTKKYQLLQQNGLVSILVHDFPVEKDISQENINETDKSEEKFEGKTVSVGIKGKLLKIDEKTSQLYRDIHLERNPKYKNFIIGDDKEILAIQVMSARVCNINDEVYLWERQDL